MIPVLLISSTTGDILYCGTSINGNRPADNAKSGIAYAPQGNMVLDDLSGGEKQMLALGRARMLRPKLLLLDEPSLGLAPTTLKKSYETIKGIRDNYQTAMLIVEQNVDAVFSIADRVYVMALGKVVAEDIPAKLPRERLKGLFLG